LGLLRKDSLKEGAVLTDAHPDVTSLRAAGWLAVYHVIRGEENEKRETFRTRSLSQLLPRDTEGTKAV
jgi:hypothetical protein